MASDNQDVYPLSRSKPESERLDLQHRVGVEVLNYLIHPKILSQLPANCRVADIGTGTGVWPLHASKVLPKEAKIVGFDISKAQFPAEHPDNVTFATCDARKSFPETEHGRYDLVHMRAVNIALHSSELNAVLKNAIEILKPGGAIQWTEADLSRLHCLRSTPDPRQFSTLPQLLDRFEQYMGERFATNWKTILQITRDHGLSSLEYDMLSTDRVESTRELGTRSYSVMILEWAVKTKEWSPEAIDQLRKGVDDDLKNGAYVRTDFATIVGFKPGRISAMDTTD